LGKTARRVVRGLAFFMVRAARVLDRPSRALAAATFTRAELDALAVREWEEFGKRGPLLGDETFWWEDQLFKKHIRPGDAILVAGAGTGRDVIPLLLEGHQVTALDITPRALEVLAGRARSHGLEAATIEASIVEADLPPRAFDVVVFSWFCFGYLRGPVDRARALARSESALRPGGRILLSYPTRRDTDPASAPPSTLGRWAARLLGGVEPERGDQFMMSGTAREPAVFFTHCFAPPEVEEEANRAGLAVVFHDQPTGGTGTAVLMRKGEARC
jgi:SAM-dependent methyltransferase